MKIRLTLALALMSIAAAAQTPGGITPEMLSEISTGWSGSSADKALRNAIGQTPINTLAVNAENAAMIDTGFSDMVRTKGITDQKSSGRCWLFTGLNVLRAAAIREASSRVAIPLSFRCAMIRRASSSLRVSPIRSRTR